MSAEILRRAAALMRERAEAADVADDSAWRDDISALLETSDDTFTQAASWAPRVSLAVAKAMDDVADAWEICNGWTRDPVGDEIPFEDTIDAGWLSVARAYLGESA